MKEQSRGRAWSTFGHFPVFGHRDGAVLVIEVSVMVFDPIVLPERGGVVVVFTADEM